MVKLVRIDAAITLVPGIKEIPVLVVLHDMLLVTNAVAIKEAVSTSVLKPTRDTAVYAVLDL